MQWEKLTAPAFTAAVKKTDVCILPLGVLERHGDHLPVGIDYLVVHKTACLAAEKEAAVVFPPFYFGQIYEARCFPGTVTLRPGLLVELLQGVMDEIGRNGFKKIILLNGHGGNPPLLKFLAQCGLWEEKPYSIYFPEESHYTDKPKKFKAVLDNSAGGHADEAETSILMALYPQLIKTGKIPKKPAKPLGRLAKLPSTFTGIGWYADHPEHYAGDASKASAEKGRKLVDLQVNYLAKYIKAVKKDKAVPALTKEFFERVKKL